MTPRFLPPGRAEKLIASDSWCASFYPPKTKQHLFINLSQNNYKFGLFRIKQSSEFKWESLSEYKGMKIALLRSNNKGPLSEAIFESGLEIVYTETFSQSLSLLLKNRVDFAFGEEYLPRDLNLPNNKKEKLQFSKTLIGNAPIGIYVNKPCIKAFSMTSS